MGNYSTIKLSIMITATVNYQHEGTPIEFWVLSAIVFPEVQKPEKGEKPAPQKAVLKFKGYYGEAAFKAGLTTGLEVNAPVNAADWTLDIKELAHKALANTKQFNGLTILVNQWPAL